MRVNQFTVIYDACVLYPAPLRDLLMQLAMTDLYRAKWTDAIHDEWIRNVLANRSDIKREQLVRTRELMNANVRDCLVTGYETLFEGITLPDPNDRHVLAAAIRAGADQIITFNLDDFPGETFNPLGIEAIDPDDFLVNQFDLAPPIVCGAAKEHRERLKKPPMDVEAYLATLEKQRLPSIVSRLRLFANLL